MAIFESIGQLQAYPKRQVLHYPPPLMLDWVTTMTTMTTMTSGPAKRAGQHYLGY